MDDILILGGSGLVGKALINEMKKRKDTKISATYCKNRIESSNVDFYNLDVEKPENIDSILNKVKPKLIISCLRGDFDKQLRLHIKAAEYLKAAGGKFYFFSTANVFDKDRSKPHSEKDSPDAQTDYGQYKIECEKRLAEILGENAVILRIPQIWGKTSPRMKKLEELLKENKAVDVYSDIMINTNTDGMLAKQTDYIIKNNLRGIFHLAAVDMIKYSDLIKEIIKGLGYKNVLLRKNDEEKSFFVLSSIRNGEFPNRLLLTNKSVINYLTK